MEQQIEELQKEVNDLQLYSIHCTNVMQYLLGLIEDLRNGNCSELEIDSLKKYIHENI